MDTHRAVLVRETAPFDGTADPARAGVALQLDSEWSVHYSEHRLSCHNDLEVVEAGSWHVPKVAPDPKCQRRLHPAAESYPSREEWAEIVVRMIRNNFGRRFSGCPRCNRKSSRSQRW